MKWFGLAALLGCNPEKNISSRGNVASGPFEICWEVYESRSGAWYNNGGNYNAKQYTSWFSVKYQGQKVRVPAIDRYKGTVQEGTKPGEPLEQFWQALFLQDAPHPAVIVGIHSMHLITEENGQLKVTPLHEQDNGFASYQWLDGNKGQPAEPQTLFLGDDSKRSRYLSGGRYLMINTKVILDVQTLRVLPIDTHVSGNDRKALQDYNATNNAVLWLSPDKTKVVLVGHRFNPENRLLSQYGLVVIDIQTTQAYAVPFDRTETRLFSTTEITDKWFDTYFEWLEDKTGEAVLSVRKLKQLPNWQGRWDYDPDTGEATGYKLLPIEDSMLPVFLDFIRNEVSVTGEKVDSIPHYEVGSPDAPSCYSSTTTLQTQGAEVAVYLYPPDHYITLRSTNNALIRQIGQHFDEALSKGKYQEYFGHYE